MSKFRLLIRKAFTPITVMLIPHSHSKHLSFKMPSIGIILSVALWLIGSVYVVSIAIDAFEYRMMKEKLSYYSKQFVELNATIEGLKQS